MAESEDHVRSLEAVPMGLEGAVAVAVVEGVDAAHRDRDSVVELEELGGRALEDRELHLLEPTRQRHVLGGNHRELAVDDLKVPLMNQPRPM